MDETKALPNNLMHFILTQLENTVGKNGVKVILKYSKLDRIIDNYPPKDFNPGEPLVTFFSIISSIMDIYGEKGYRSLLRGVGKNSFNNMIQELPWLFGVGEIEYDDFAPVDRYPLLYKTFVNNLNKVIEAKTTLEISPNQVVDIAHNCMWCTGLKASGPICIFTEDFFKTMANWSGVSDITVVETHCCACGDPYCRFVSTFS